MKNLSNNKKGFTLIELLAVIVILAILVMLAIPAVTRYLTTARKNAFSDNALRAVEAVRNDVVFKGFSNTRTKTSDSEKSTIKCDGTKCYYGLTAINELLETKLTNSPFGNDYTSANAFVCIVADQANQTYTMTMIDGGKNGFADLVAGSSDKDKAINDENVKADSSVEPPTGTNAVATADCGGADMGKAAASAATGQ